MMDDLLKELDALERATSFLPPAPTPTASTSSTPSTPGPSKPARKPAHSVSEALDTLLSQLEHAKASLGGGETSHAVVAGVVKDLEETRRAVDERQKEGVRAYTEFGKTVDKTFSNGLLSLPKLFASEPAKRALDRSVATHLLRKGSFDLASVLIHEAHIELPPETSEHFRSLHAILTALNAGDVAPALAWARANEAFLAQRESALSFRLHRHQYLQLLLSPSLPPSDAARAALAYARTNLTPLYPAQHAEIQLLLNAVSYLPLARLQASPYAQLAQDASDGARALAPLFSTEWCARLGLPNEPPLEVVAGIGGGSALSVLDTNRRKMAKARNEWSSVSELPVGADFILVELPVPVRHRYHTIVCCPVVREPTTEENPPMLLTCGHVISKEAITRLQKGAQRVKCPYCPVESSASQALRLYF